MASGPSRTRTASPCPTSRTVSTLSPGTPGHAAIAASTAIAAAAALAPCVLRGSGQHAHSAARDATQSTHDTHAGSVASKAAPGRTAPERAIAAATEPAATAHENPARAKTGARGRTIVPRHAKSTVACITGSIARATSGAHGLTAPNAEAATGAEPHCAASAVPAAPATHRHPRGRRAAAHHLANGPRATIPMTAHTPRPRPASKAAPGSPSTTHAIATASAPEVSERLPMAPAALVTAKAITARASDARGPQATIALAATATHTATCAGRGKPSPRHALAASSAATATCTPDSTRANANPHERKSSSTALPDTAARSPRAAARTTSAPEPLYVPIASSARARQRPSTPAGPGAQPVTETFHGRHRSTCPRRTASSHPLDSASVPRTLPRTSRRTPARGGAIPCGISTSTIEPASGPEATRTATLGAPQEVTASHTVSPPHEHG